MKALRVLRYFNDLEGPALYPRVIDTEHRLQADQQSHILHGVVDLLVSSEADGNSASDCELWDYKGVRRLGLTVKDLATYEFQMRVYARLYRLKHGVMPRRAVLYFLNELDGPTAPSVRPVNAVMEVSLDPEEVEEAVSVFNATVQGIERARLQNQWLAAKPGEISEQDCAVCDFQWDCATPNNGQGVSLRCP